MKSTRVLLRVKYAFAILLFAAWPIVQVRSATHEFSFVEKVTGDGALPMVIALHGLGDTPERYSELFADLGVPVRLIVPRAPDPWPVGSSWFPFDDKKRAASELLARAGQVAEFARSLGKQRKVRGLPIVTGFSQGGCLSFAIAAHHSDAFSAALPVAGLLLGGAAKKARADFRVVAFHGDQDTRIPLAEGQRAAKALERAGTNVTLATYEGVGHGFSAREQRDYLAALREEIDRTR